MYSLTANIEPTTKKEPDNGFLKKRVDSNFFQFEKNIKLMYAFHFDHYYKQCLLLSIWTKKKLTLSINCSIIIHKRNENDEI